MASYLINTAIPPFTLYSKQVFSPIYFNKNFMTLLIRGDKIPFVFSERSRACIQEDKGCMITGKRPFRKIEQMPLYCLNGLWQGGLKGPDRGMQAHFNLWKMKTQIERSLRACKRKLL